MSREHREESAAGATPDYSKDRSAPAFRRKVLQIGICVVILLIGMAGAAYFKKTAPKARKRPPEKMAPLVQAERLYPGDHRIIINAMGTVVPARQIILKSRVAGEVVSIHAEFAEGGILKAGDEVLSIDPVDYELAIVQKQAEVVSTEYALKVELGNQEVAKREWALFHGDQSFDEQDRELALRQPHLKKAQADVSSARAELKLAEVNLIRTRIQVPFNAVVRSKYVDLGSKISTQDQLAELLFIDEYWIKASVPADRLKWMAVPRFSGETGSPARISYQNGPARSGRVVRLLSDMETEGRMARVLISVKDPLGLNAPHDDLPPLLIDQYVQVEIEGRRIENVYRIPRTALRDNTHIWIAGKDDRLQIRSIQTLWRDIDTVFIEEGLQPGDRLIVSDISTPIAGMPLNVELADDGKQP